MLTLDKMLKALEKSKIPFQHVDDTVNFVIKKGDFFNIHRKEIALTFDKTVKEFLDSKSRHIQIINPIKSSHIVTKEGKTLFGNALTVFMNLVQLKKPAVKLKDKPKAINITQKNYELRKYYLGIDVSKTDLNKPEQSTNSAMKLIKPYVDVKPTSIMRQPIQF